jgi:hypothetical protein
VVAMFVNGSGRFYDYYVPKKHTIFCEILFLAHLAKGNVCFCHHLASVDRRPLTLKILIFSSETPEPNELKLGN